MAKMNHNHQLWRPVAVFLRSLCTVLMLISLIMIPSSGFSQVASLDRASENNVKGKFPRRAPADKIVIGVRGLAAPFSSRNFIIDPPLANLTAKSGPLRSRGYDGYMVYICDEVLKMMLIDEGGPPVLKSTEIDVLNIDDLMSNSETGTDRFVLLDNDIIDIMCDPATISRERLRNHAASPPLFLTGIGYLILSGKPGPGPGGICQYSKSLIGAVGTTNAVSIGISAILEAGEWPMLKEDIYKWLTVSDHDSLCPQYNNHQGLIWYSKNHYEVAKAFCSGEIAYYLGDLEIIRENVRQIPGCTASSGVQRFTSDRYAVFADMEYDNHWKSRMIARFFEVLNREVISSDSLLDRAYIAAFGSAKPSQQLELFYWSVRGAP